MSKDLEAELNARAADAKAPTAEELFKSFKRQRLLDDRREYTVQDLMRAYTGLTQAEAEKLYRMCQSGQAQDSKYDDIYKGWSKELLQTELRENEEDLKHWLEKGYARPGRGDDPSTYEVQEMRQISAYLKKLISQMK